MTVRTETYDRAAHVAAIEVFLGSLGVAAMTTVVVAQVPPPTGERRAFYDDAVRTGRRPVLVVDANDPDVVPWSDGVGVALFCTAADGRVEPLSIEARALLDPGVGAPATGDWRLNALVRWVEEALAAGWSARVRWRARVAPAAAPWFEVQVAGHVRVIFGAFPDPNGSNAGGVARQVEGATGGESTVAVVCAGLARGGYTLDHFAPGPLGY